MKKKLFKTNYFFVDEAGDSTFYNKYGKYIVGEEGCSKLLLLGFIRTTDPVLLRQAVLNLRQEVAQDPYLQSIPSVSKTKIAFHAKDDCPEVREKFYKTIAQLDFKAEFVVARKIESVFRGKHKGSENSFYSDLIIQLFRNKLHLADKSVICFASRGSQTKQKRLDEAIAAARSAFEKQWNTPVNTAAEQFAQSPSGEPCLQIVDYMNWAVQRAFVKGEDRYLKFMASKISFLVDIYDFPKYPNNFYNNKTNIFDINKISPL